MVSEFQGFKLQNYPIAKLQNFLSFVREVQSSPGFRGSRALLTSLPLCYFEEFPVRCLLTFVG